MLQADMELDRGEGILGKAIIPHGWNRRQKGSRLRRREI
jgi:hypothetical protein